MYEIVVLVLVVVVASMSVGEGEGWPVVVSGLPEEVGEVDAALSKVVGACGWVRGVGWERNAAPGAEVGGGQGTAARSNGPPTVARHGFAVFVTLHGAMRCLESVDGMVLGNGAGRDGVSLRAAAPRPTRDAIGRLTAAAAAGGGGGPGLEADARAVEAEAAAMRASGDTLPGVLRELGASRAEGDDHTMEARVDADVRTFLGGLFQPGGGGDSEDGGVGPKADAGPARGVHEEDAAAAADAQVLLGAIPSDAAELFAHPVAWDALLLHAGGAGLGKVAAWAATKSEKLGVGSHEAVGELVGERLRERPSPLELVQSVTAAFPGLGEADVDALVASVWRVLIFEATKARQGAAAALA